MNRDRHRSRQFLSDDATAERQVDVCRRSLVGAVIARPDHRAMSPRSTEGSDISFLCTRPDLHAMVPTQGGGA